MSKVLLFTCVMCCCAVCVGGVRLWERADSLGLSAVRAVIARNVSQQQQQKGSSDQEIAEARKIGELGTGPASCVVLNTNQQGTCMVDTSRCLPDNVDALNSQPLAFMCLSKNTTISKHVIPSCKEGGQTTCFKANTRVATEATCDACRPATIQEAGLSVPAKAAFYGPQGCVFTYRTPAGTCAIETRCQGVGSSDFEAFNIGMTCVARDGTCVKHLYGAGSFETAEVYDTTVECQLCLGLDSSKVDAQSVEKVKPKNQTDEVEAQWKQNAQKWGESVSANLKKLDTEVEQIGTKLKALENEVENLKSASNSPSKANTSASFVYSDQLYDGSDFPHAPRGMVVSRRIIEHSRGGGVKEILDYSPSTSGPHKREKRKVIRSVVSEGRENNDADSYANSSDLQGTGWDAEQDTKPVLRKEGSRADDPANEAVAKAEDFATDFDATDSEDDGDETADAEKADGVGDD